MQPSKKPAWQAYEKDTLLHFARTHPGSIVWPSERAPERLVSRVIPDSKRRMRLARKEGGFYADFGADGFALMPACNTLRLLQAKLYDRCKLKPSDVATFHVLCNGLHAREEGTKGVLLVPPSTQTTLLFDVGMSEMYGRVMDIERVPPTIVPRMRIRFCGTPRARAMERKCSITCVQTRILITPCSSTHATPPSGSR